MSKPESEASKAAQGEPENDSVFDFLYHDVRRVGSFLAQFYDAGHLQQVTQSDGATRGSKRGWKAAAGGSLPTVGSVNISAERTPEKGGFEALERTYDPLWTNARTLLDFLSERGLIRRALSDASIGQFVLVSGKLLILDLAMMKNLWENQTIKRLIAQGAEQTSPSSNRQQRRSSSHKEATASVSPEVELMMAILPMMPHVLQCRVIGGDINAWCNLDEEFIVGKSSDLMLKHGVVLQGQWSVLGIVDAHPDSDIGDDADLNNIIAGLEATPIGLISVGMAPMARTLLGRPNDAYGITPLLIFREVSG